MMWPLVGQPQAREGPIPNTSWVTHTEFNEDIRKKKEEENKEEGKEEEEGRGGRRIEKNERVNLKVSGKGWES